MSRIFIWLVSSSTLIVSERDPDEIVQTHMLSWAFAEVPAGSGAPRKLISCSGPSCVQEKSTRMELE